MATIDVDALRGHMKEQCGTAIFGGFPAAIVDLADVEYLDGYELCRKAEMMGVDLRQFEVCDDEDTTRGFT